MTETSATPEATEAKPKVTRRPLPASDPAAKVVARGKGNWHNAVERRIKPDAAGMEVPEAGRGSVVRKADATHGTADVKFSPAADAAVGAVVRESAAKVGDGFDARVATTSVAAAAATFAKNRGAKSVWDIDVAAAIGYAWTPEGAKAFRADFHLPAPAAPWPKRVAETPDAQTPRGQVIDPLTGKVAS